MRFIFTRHTTTEWNLAGILQGQTDIPLNQQGRAEARQLAHALQGLSITKIVSSDLKRAKETAEIINDVLKIPLQSDQRIRECSFGSLEGLTDKQATERHGLPAPDHTTDQHVSYDFRPFGGENRNEVLERHIATLNELVETQDGNIILLVGHSRGLCTLLAELGQAPNLKRGEYRTVEFGLKQQQVE